jgi:hypothetical protein
MLVVASVEVFVTVRFVIVVVAKVEFPVTDNVAPALTAPVNVEAPGNS